PSDPRSRPEAALREGPRAPVSASLQPAPAIATDRRARPELRVRVGLVRGTGYVGAELVRLLARHPFVEIVGLTARSRSNEAVGGTHPPLASTRLAAHR